MHSSEEVKVEGVRWAGRLQEEERLKEKFRKESQLLKDENEIMAEKIKKSEKSEEGIKQETPRDESEWISRKEK